VYPNTVYFDSSNNVLINNCNYFNRPIKINISTNNLNNKLFIFNSKPNHFAIIRSCPNFDQDIYVHIDKNINHIIVDKFGYTEYVYINGSFIDIVKKIYKSNITIDCNLNISAFPLSYNNTLDQYGFTEFSGNLNINCDCASLSFIGNSYEYNLNVQNLGGSYNRIIFNNCGLNLTANHIHGLFYAPPREYNYRNSNYLMNKPIYLTAEYVNDLFSPINSYKMTPDTKMNFNCPVFIYQKNNENSLTIRNIITDSNYVIFTKNSSFNIIGNNIIIENNIFALSSTSSGFSLNIQANYLSRKNSNYIFSSISSNYIVGYNGKISLDIEHTENLHLITTGPYFNQEISLTSNNLYLGDGTACFFGLGNFNRELKFDNIVYTNIALAELPNFNSNLYLSTLNNAYIEAFMYQCNNFNSNIFITLGGDCTIKNFMPTLCNLTVDGMEMNIYIKKSNNVETVNISRGNETVGYARYMFANTGGNYLILNRMRNAKIKIYCDPTCYIQLSSLSSYLFNHCDTWTLGDNYINSYNTFIYNCQNIDEIAVF
jgi:hypothetical protein